jgi:hypothetical protein
METFFVPPTTARLTRHPTFHQSKAKARGQELKTPPLSTSEGGIVFDDETMRWLEQYPQDPELVPLMTDLRAGGQNDDFILSDVGLLYLRPDEQDPSAAALLVPPNGVIRREVLQDAHIAEDGKHKQYQTMVNEMGEIFWWAGMQDDIELEIATCQVCAKNGNEGPGVQGLKVGDHGTGDSRSMYTGVTGWSKEDTAEEREREMAAEMAIAIRRADDDAKRQWGGT